MGSMQGRTLVVSWLPGNPPKGGGVRHICIGEVGLH